MSDSDEDYTSDKFLLTSNKNDVRPGLLFSKTQKRQHDIFKKKLEDKANKPKPYHEQEKEAREKGLNTAISSDNKGFKLLAKMGYKAGNSLGKTDDGLKEPITIIPKSSSSGVGRETHIKEKIVKKRTLKEQTYNTNVKVFKAAKYEKNTMLMLRKDFYKAQQVCENLDYQNGIESLNPSLFWTKQTVKNLKEQKKKKKTDDDEDDEEISESSDEEFEEEATEENLSLIIEYLRKKHLYCLYCIFKASNIDDLEANCPGPYRSDHDDLDI